MSVLSIRVTELEWKRCKFIVCGGGIVLIPACVHVSSICVTSFIAFIQRRACPLDYIFNYFHVLILLQIDKNSGKSVPWYIDSIKLPYIQSSWNFIVSCMWACEEEEASILVRCTISSYHCGKLPYTCFCIIYFLFKFRVKFPIQGTFENMLHVTFENVMPRAAVCLGIAVADQESEERDVLQRQSRCQEALTSLRETHKLTLCVCVSIVSFLNPKP